MDGLSVAASIVGLIQAASATASFISSFKNSPALAGAVHAEVSALSVIFVQVHELLCYKRDMITEERSSMLSVDHVMITVAGLVHEFSELKRLLNGLLEDGVPPWGPTEGSEPIRMTMGLNGTIILSRRAWNRAKWTLKAKDIETILSTLRMHKESLTLMLTIATCQSNLEAAAQMKALHRTIESLLRTNESLVAAIDNLKARQIAPTDSIRMGDSSFSHELSRDGARSLTMTRRSSFPSLRSIRLTHSQGSTGDDRFSAVEAVLYGSRPYVRLRRRESLGTVKTLVTAMSQWSDFENLSVAEISDISVLRLPFYPEDLENSECYSFYGEPDEVQLSGHSLLQTQATQGFLTRLKNRWNEGSTENKSKGKEWRSGKVKSTISYPILLGSTTLFVSDESPPWTKSEVRFEEPVAWLPPDDEEEDHSFIAQYFYKAEADNYEFFGCSACDEPLQESEAFELGLFTRFLSDYSANTIEACSTFHVDCFNRLFGRSTEAPL